MRMKLIATTASMLIFTLSQRDSYDHEPGVDPGECRHDKIFARRLRPLESG
jgi:hypothetical protein